MKRLAVVCTHPIQYYAPVFRLLAERAVVQLKVFYTWGNAAQSQYDPGFGKTISWDIPLLEGYVSVFVSNTSKKPGSDHFWGIVNPTLTQEVLAWQPDAVLVYGWNYHSHLQLIWRLKGRVPVWFRGDSNILDPQPKWKALLKKWVLRQVYRLVDRAFYVGTANKQYYLAYGLREEQLVFAPHAIDNARFEDTPNSEYTRQAEIWRKELGFTSKDIVLLFAGKFEPKKAPLQLLQALQQYNQVNPKNVKLLFIGNGILEEALKAKAQNDPNIRFLDFQNQSKMPIVYRIGDVFCLPSLGPGETWGLAVNEAMVCGRAVAVSDRVGCATDLVKIGKNGFILETGQLIETLLKLMEACNDKSMLLSMGEESKSIITNWTVLSQVRAFEENFPIG